MPSIKFNPTTKEIEIEGPESFIESNFYRVQDLVLESLGVKKTKVSRKPHADEEPIGVETMEIQIAKGTKVPEVSEISEELLTTKPGIPDVPQKPGVKRPPVRKYIRVGEKSVSKVPIDDQMKLDPEGISIASLKEKFGLSDQKIGAIIREAEKQGRVQKDMDGSYVWI
jgi:hypothetical protein